MSAPVPAHPLADAAGVHAIPVPTPFAVGRMNAWLLRGDPLTLVDTGPNSATAWLALEAGLDALGVDPVDLEVVVLTHEHVDHVGLTAPLVARSGATVLAIDALARTVAAGRERQRQEADFSRALLLRHGVPPDVVTALASVGEQFRAWRAPYAVDRGLLDGERIRLGGRDWTVGHRPGHSPTDTVLHSADGLMLGGDHLLAEISSNPIATLAPDAAAADPALRAPALVQYVASMRATAADGPQLVLPGHGPVVEDPAGLVRDRLGHHARRAERIAALLAAHGPRSAFGVCDLLWGELRLRQPLLTLSEVLGHLDLLVAEGTVVAVAPDAAGVERWART